MTKQDFEQLCYDCVDILRARCPRDTGNLSDHGIQFIWEDEGTFTIYVNETQAPYMPYTNEPWISERWHGKQNPNEGWWHDAVKMVMDFFTSMYDGEITESEND